MIDDNAVLNDVAIDFSHIRAMGHRGRSEGFEHLVASLVHAERPPGAAGVTTALSKDGGLDCFWRLPSGELAGWECKYRSRAGDLRQADLVKSFTTALRSYPGLTRYTFALSIYPTLPQTKTVEAALAECRAIAERAGHVVDVEVWWANDIAERLDDDRGRVRRAYWFGGNYLADTWWKNRAQQAVRRARDSGEAPGGGLQSIVSALCGDGEWVEHATALARGLDEVRAVSPADRPEPVAQALERCAATLATWVAEPTPDALELLRATLQDVDARIRTCHGELGVPLRDAHGTWSDEQEREISGDLGTVPDALAWVDRVSHAVSDVARLVESPAARAYGSQIATLVVPPGVEVSGPVARLAEKRVDRQRRGVVVPGENFRSETTPRRDLVAALDLPFMSGEQALQLLDEAGRAVRRPVLVLIPSVDRAPVPWVPCAQDLSLDVENLEFVRLLFTVTGPAARIPEDLNPVVVGRDVVQPPPGTKRRAAVAAVAAAGALAVTVSGGVWERNGDQQKVTTSTPPTPAPTTPGVPVGDVQLRLTRPVRIPGGKVRVDWTPTLPGYSFVVEVWPGTPPVQSKPVGANQAATIDAPAGVALCIRVRGDNGMGGIAKSNVVRMNSTTCEFPTQ